MHSYALDLYYIAQTRGKVLKVHHLELRKHVQRFSTSQGLSLSTWGSILRRAASSVLLKIHGNPAVFLDDPNSYLSGGLNPLEKVSHVPWMTRSNIQHPHLLLAIFRMISLNIWDGPGWGRLAGRRDAPIQYSLPMCTLKWLQCICDCFCVSISHHKPYPYCTWFV